MTDAPIIYQIPEPIYVTLLISWIVACMVAFVAGFFMGVSNECRRRMK